MTTNILKLITLHNRIERKLVAISKEFNMLTLDIAPPSKPPIVLYFKNDPLADCVTLLLEKCCLIVCTSWHDLSEKLQLDTKFLVIHIDTILESDISIPEWMELLNNTTKVLGVRPLSIGVVIRKTTPITAIKELKKTAVTGICLDISDYDIADVNYSLDQLLVHRPYWPTRIIEQLPGNTATPVVSTVPGNRLTTRQQQVLKLIVTRGANNKDIGRILGISSNTVKVHVGNIMKIYGVRTRLQLVIAATPKN